MWGRLIICGRLLIGPLIMKLYRMGRLPIGRRLPTCPTFQPKSLSEQRQNLGKALADLPDHRRRIAKEVALLSRGFLCGAIGGLRVMLARARVEMLPRAFDRESFVVQQMLD